MDENQNDVNPSESSTEEQESNQDQVNEDSQGQDHSEPENKSDKYVPYDRFKKVNDELADLKKQPKSGTSDDPIDLIKLGKKLQDYSDEELDFVTEHAKSKKPDDILKALENPFVQAGINAHREKLEKELQALKPSTVQSDSEQPKNFIDKLKNASLADKEKMLKEAGLYKEVRPRADRTHIGNQR